MVEKVSPKVIGVLKTLIPDAEKADKILFDSTEDCFVRKEIPEIEKQKRGFLKLRMPDLMVGLLNRLGFKPEFMYRGNTGPQYVPYVVKDILENPAEVKKLSEKLRNLSDKLDESDFYKSITKNQSGPSWFYDQHSPQEHEKAAEYILLEYLIYTIEKSLEKSNFNIFYKEAKTWAESSKIPLFKVNNLGNPLGAYGKALRINDADKLKDSWAKKMLEKIRSLKFVLKAKTPENVKLYEDVNVDNSFGIMSKINPIDIVKSSKDEWIYKVIYDGKTYSPNKSKELWKPLNDFVQNAGDIIINSKESDSIEDVLNEIRSLNTQ